MRELGFKTIGLVRTNLRKYYPTLQRSTLYNLEKRLGIYDPEKITQGGWRRYSEEEFVAFQVLVLKNYSITLPKELQTQLTPAVKKQIEFYKKRAKDSKYLKMLNSLEELETEQ